VNHKQLLDHLAAGQIPAAMAYDVSRLAKWSMMGPGPVPHAEVQRDVLSKFFRRWNCVFDAPDEEVAEGYRDKAWVVAAATLHKYGFRDDTCTDQAIQALDRLDARVALSDRFAARAGEAKDLLRSMPVPLKRRPAVPDEVTSWRAGDVVSYRLDGRYYVCYVRDILTGNTAPLIEFYDLVLDRPPTVTDITGAHAVGGRYNDGVRRIEMYWVYGMRGNPDLANQFTLVEAGVDSPPLQTHLAPAVAGGSVIDIFRLQNEIDRSF